MAFWYVLVPAAATLATVGYLVPAASAAGAPFAPLWQLAHEQPLVLAAGVFLGFAGLVTYWSPVLPGAQVPERPRGRTRVRLAGVLAVAAVALAAVAGLAVAQVYRPAGVVSTSMLPSIVPGDRVWVEKRAYGAGRVPARGDVIVFAHAGEDDDGALVKRVIGLPGDHITMHDGHPVVNGQEVRSCDAGTFVYLGASRSSRGHLSVEWLDGHAYLTVQSHGTHAFSGYEVQPGEVFVLGDNRGVSNDSRSWQRGPGVASAQIEGRVERVLFGEDRGGHLDRARLWAPLGLEPYLPGVDLAPLRAGIERCLREG